MKAKTERRTLPPTEFRVVETDGRKKIRGYAAVFNRESEILWYFREIVKPGAFRDALRKSDIRALVDHDPSRILGRYIAERGDANTLHVREDETGLYYEIDPPDTSIGRDILVSIERGDVTGSSFAFTVATDTWRTVDGQQIREIEKIDEVFDVSPVTYPAYPDTSVDVRSLDELTPLVRSNLVNRFGTLEDIERLAAEHRETPHRPTLAKRLDQLVRDSQNRRVIL